MLKNMKQKTTKNKKLLLHCCCADCTIKALRQLQYKYQITLLFDNSNIHPRSEYLARIKAIKQVAQYNKIKLKISNWSPKEWYKAIKYTSNNKYLRRCKLCWQLRLTNTANITKELSFNKFSTTLLTSHYQNRTIIENICKTLQSEKIKFISISKPKKQIHTSGFYKQNYCGCIYSTKRRYEQKFITQHKR